MQPLPPGWLQSHRRVFGGHSLDKADLEYSDSNEDVAASLRALDVQPGNIVVGVTGSADLLLLALQHNPAFVAGYDLNPAQNALAELKRAAIAHLSYPEFLSLLGYRDDPHRRRLLTAVHPSLPDDVRAFWQRDDMIQAVDAGLWKQGTATKKDIASWHTALRELEARIGPHDLQLVLGRHGTREQRQVLRTRIARTDPKYAEPAIRNKNHYKFDAFRYPDGMANEPVVARYAEPWLPAENVVPPIGQADFERIQPNIHRISFQTCSAADALRHMPADAFDRIYLSNVTEYLTVAQEQELVELLLEKGRPAALVVLLYLALSPAQQRDLLDHSTWSERGLARVLRASQWKERFQQALEENSVPRSQAETWIRNAYRSVDRFSRGGAADTLERLKHRLQSLDRDELAQQTERTARRAVDRVCEYDYARAGQRAKRSLKAGWKEAQDRVAEARQLAERDHVLVENQARTAALFSDVYANLRATYAAKSFYVFDYAILRKVTRTGPTYDIPS